MPKDDFEGVLTDLKRHREDLDRRLKDLATDGEATTDIINRLQQWRERNEQIIADDPTPRGRKET